MRRETQGRCRPCKIAYRWLGKPLLREALCPKCSRPLARTTGDLTKVPWLYEAPHRLVPGVTIKEKLK